LSRRGVTMVQWRQHNTLKREMLCLQQIEHISTYWNREMDLQRSFLCCDTMLETNKVKRKSYLVNEFCTCFDRVINPTKSAFIYIEVDWCCTWQGSASHARYICVCLFSWSAYAWCAGIPWLKVSFLNNIQHMYIVCVCVWINNQCWNASN
jgi:hypothetical protein